MKKIMILIVFFIIASFVLPLAVFYSVKLKGTEGTKKSTKNEEIVNVLFTDENKVKAMPLEEYLVGVVSAEMPASFEYEALKAQAVAARSYAMYKKSKGGVIHTPSADVCTDYRHCKAYKTIEKAREKWGKDADNYEKKIKGAVSDTRGEILTYNGDAALAVFHAQTGGGKTENSKDVWGGDVPYLISVDAGGENVASNFYSSKTISFEEFKNALNTKDANINSPNDIKPAILSEGGAVKEITIGTKKFKGSEIRSIFGLRSACFKISVDDKNVHFEVFGYGHGVGMSQYGANELAKKGSDYKEILEHYYTGTRLDYMNI